MRRLGPAVIALGGLWLVRVAAAQDAEPPPDLDFLQYLGSWQGRDDEWLAIAEWDKDHPRDGERRSGRSARDAADPDDDAADEDAGDAAGEPADDSPPPAPQRSEP